MKEFDQPPLPPLESTYPRIPAPKRRNFHGSLRFILKSLTPVMTITFVFTAVAIYLVDGGQDVSMTGLLGASFGSALGVALSMFVANKLWTIRILPRGLYTYNGMGTCATLPWETLSYAGILKLFGLRYFRFRCQGFLFAYLVPVELDHPPGFPVRALRKLAARPPRHPSGPRRILALLCSRPCLRSISRFGTPNPPKPGHRRYHLAMVISERCTSVE